MRVGRQPRLAGHADGSPRTRRRPRATAAATAAADCGTVGNRAPTDVGPRTDHLGGTSNPAAKDLLFDNGIGGFTSDGREYTIRMAPVPRKDAAPRGNASPLPEFPPAPWSNVIANPSFGFLVTERGGGCTWAGNNSQLNRLTPWSNDAASDPPGEVIYLRDEATGEVWTPTALPPRGPAAYTAHHGQGYTVFTYSGRGLDHELLLFVPLIDPVKVMRLKVRNTGRQPRRLSAAFFAEWVLGTVRDQSAMRVLTEVDADTGALLGAIASTRTLRRRWPSRTSTPGRGRIPATAPNSLAATARSQARPRWSVPAWSGAVGAGIDPCAALQTSFDLQPGEEKEIVFLLGEAANIEEARRLVNQYRQPERPSEAFREIQDRWEGILGTVQVQTPNPALDLLLNRWLPYQVLSCRVWGRTAFYQSGGAYGFRDQLQDVLALVYAAPQETRAQILRAASRQFLEGDVQHWWHPPHGAGVRTRCSDDYLWLPFAVAHYVAVTGDAAVLEEREPFLQAPSGRRSG